MSTSSIVSRASLALVLCGCSPGADQTPPAPAKAPDLGLIELCPPKGLPPGTISREEQQKRDAERIKSREEELKKAKEDLARKFEDDKKIVEAACAAAAGK